MKNETIKHLKYETRGNVTECALLNFFLKQNNDVYQELKKKDDFILQSIPFNSKRKRASTVMTSTDDSSRVRVYLKGAPEIVLDYCSKIKGKSGEDENLSDGDKSNLMKNIIGEQFAKQAYRCILVAYTEMSMDEYESIKSKNNNFEKESDREVLEQDMTVICIYAL